MYDVIIIDGNNMANKAYFINGWMQAELNGTTYKTGILYGMLNMILTVIKSGIINDRPKVFCIWDTPTGSDFRNSLMKDYKSTRAPQTAEEYKSKSEFYSQLEFTKRELLNFRIYQSEKEGHEADDIIFTFLKEVLNRNHGRKVLIISEDKDFRQLISHKTHLYGISGKTIWDEEFFIKKTGICKPKFFADYLSLAGDSSDNYSGVKGIGDKTAQTILNDEIFANVESPVLAMIENPALISELKITAKLKDTISSNIEELKMNYALACFYEVPDISFKHKRKIDPVKAFAMLEKYAMQSLLSDENKEFLTQLL